MSAYIANQSYVEPDEFLDHPGCSSSRRLVKVTITTPTGLLIVGDNKDSRGNDINVCLLQHNVVSLRPHYKLVKELKSAISPKECAKIIKRAEEYAANNGGWTNSRHTNYATTDIPLELLYGEDNHIEDLVIENILPEIAAFYGLNKDFIHIGELFVVKYEYHPHQQSGLNAHVDGTPWSFVVTLNDASEYSGGGTRFIGSGATCRPSKPGSAVLFSGKNRHEGVEVTAGTRYILTGFCEYVSECDDDCPSPHSVFLRDYDGVYDGGAAAGGIMTGDIFRGIYSKGTDGSEDLTMFTVDNNISKVVSDMKASGSASLKGFEGPKEWTFLLERLISTEYNDDDDDDEGDNDDINNVGNGVVVEGGVGEGKTREDEDGDEEKEDLCSVNSLTSVEMDLKDDQGILRLIHNADQFLTVGIYYKFDDL